MSRNYITLTQYIETRGLSPIAKDLKTTPSTVFNWRTHFACPRPTQALKLIKLSAGILTWESIYQPYVDHKMKLAKKNKDQSKQLSFNI